MTTMTPELVTEPNQPLPEKYSGDFREVFYLAEVSCRQRAKRNGDGFDKDADVLPTAADCWLALASIARPFSLPARLIKGLGLSSRQIKKTVSQSVKKGGSHSSTVDWALVAAKNASQHGKKEVQLADLLAGLLAVDDGTATALLQPARSSQPYAIAREQQRSVGFLPVSKNTFFQLAFYLREIAEMIVVMVLFLIIIKEGLGELRLIPSESMVPTLQIGDRLVIEKATRWFREPERGDVMVFYPPEPDAILREDPFSWIMRSTGFSSLFHNSAEDPIDKAYIKRLIALPGDTVWVVQNYGVFVNDELLNEPYINEIALTCGNLCLPVTVPENHYLMLGDNRNRSKDGRFFGFVPKERLVGRAVYRIWPVDRIGAVE